MPISFSGFPPEIKLIILSFLDINSLKRMRLVDKESDKLAKESLEKIILSQYLKLPTTNINAPIPISPSNKFLGKYAGVLPIFVAIQLRSIKIVKWLIEKDVDVDVDDKNLNNVFHYATKYTNPYILEEIMKVKYKKLTAEMKSIGRPPDTSWWEYNKQDIQPNMFLERNYLPDNPIHKKYQEIFMRYYGYPNELLQQNISSSSSNGIPILNTIGLVEDRWIDDEIIRIKQIKMGNLEFHSFEEVIKIIKRQKIDLYNPQKPFIALFLSHAQYSGNQDPIKGRSILHWAVATGNRKSLQFLFSLDSDGIYGNETAINKRIKQVLSNLLIEQDEDGNTPLHIAAKNKDLKMVKLLINKGAARSITVENNKNESPISVAYNHLEEHKKKEKDYNEKRILHYMKPCKKEKKLSGTKLHYEKLYKELIKLAPIPSITSQINYS